MLCSQTGLQQRGALILYENVTTKTAFIQNYCKGMTETKLVVRNVETGNLIHFTIVITARLNLKQEHILACYE